ncbi:MAG: hypothetical protein K940chlam2_01173 [Chlamydiae bacterium]|nr:hypothetical protein [Chlamydiota bacterium]
MKLLERKSCRASNGPLVDVFDLGKLPLSCFPQTGLEKPTPLPLSLCLNEESGLVQLRHTFDPEEMYNEYWYMSGINLSMKLALKSIVDQAMERVGLELSGGDIVLDIASNDGTLLSVYPENFYRVGIDPAKNIKPKNCDLHINTYFSSEVYKEKLGDKKAKIVTSIAVFYDLEDPVKFSRDVAEVLQPGGLWIIELSYLPTMLENNAFETICSEHLEYYSLQSVEYILDRAGLEVEDVELNDVNGGSFRLYIRHKGLAKETPAVEIMRQKEKALKLTEREPYEAFANRVEQNREEMIDFLKKAKAEGKKVLGYGASTKGNTLMAYYGIGPDLVSHVAERNPIKWGRHTVTRIPIISEEEMRQMEPDYLVAFPYHFMSEFLEREKELLNKGCQFISPIPKLTFFSGE